MKIDAIMGYRVSYSPTMVTLIPNDSVSPLLKLFQEQNITTYVRAILSRPYREKSTGKHSQVNHIWGHITTIAMATGDTVDDVEYFAKLKAISRGYPYHISRLTNEMRPDSISTIDTAQACALIDTLHQIAADHGITMIEGE